MLSPALDLLTGDYATAFIESFLAQHEVVHLMTNEHRDILFFFTNDFAAKNVVAAWHPDTGELCAVALLHNVDFDPQAMRSAPRMLDLLFVLPNWRGHGIGRLVLHYLVCDRQMDITAYCDSKASLALFNSTGLFRKHQLSDAFSDGLMMKSVA